MIIHLSPLVIWFWQLLLLAHLQALLQFVPVVKGGDREYDERCVRVVLSVGWVLLRQDAESEQIWVDLVRALNMVFDR